MPTARPIRQLPRGTEARIAEEIAHEVADELRARRLLLHIPRAALVEQIRALLPVATGEKILEAAGPWGLLRRI